jgi:hypothetical protein
MYVFFKQSPLAPRWVEYDIMWLYLSKCIKNRMSVENDYEYIMRK